MKKCTLRSAITQNKIVYSKISELCSTLLSYVMPIYQGNNLFLCDINKCDEINVIF